MHFFWEHFNFKHKKPNTNDSASKAKSCHMHRLAVYAKQGVPFVSDVS